MFPMLRYARAPCDRGRILFVLLGNPANENHLKPARWKFCFQERMTAATKQYHNDLVLQERSLRFMLPLFQRICCYINSASVHATVVLLSISAAQSLPKS